jgi:hypothetical protein
LTKPGGLTTNVVTNPFLKGIYATKTPHRDYHINPRLSFNSHATIPVVVGTLWNSTIHNPEVLPPVIKAIETGADQLQALFNAGGIAVSNAEPFLAGEDNPWLFEGINRDRAFVFAPYIAEATLKQLSYYYRLNGLGEKLGLGPREMTKIPMVVMEQAARESMFYNEEQGIHGFKMPHVEAMRIVLPTQLGRIFERTFSLNGAVPLVNPDQLASIALADLARANERIDISRTGYPLFQEKAHGRYS